MAHETQELPRADWRVYFDGLSRDLPTVEATVEIEGLDLGAQVEAESLVLTGISYDDRDDVLVVGLGGVRERLEHLVQQPKRILVDSTLGVLPTTIEVHDGEGHRTLIRLRQVQAIASE